MKFRLEWKSYYADCNVVPVPVHVCVPMRDQFLQIKRVRL